MLRIYDSQRINWVVDPCRQVRRVFRFSHSFLAHSLSFTWEMWYHRRCCEVKPVSAPCFPGHWTIFWSSVILSLKCPHTHYPPVKQANVGLFKHIHSLGECNKNTSFILILRPCNCTCCTSSLTIQINLNDVHHLPQAPCAWVVCIPLVMRIIVHFVCLWASDCIHRPRVSQSSSWNLPPFQHPHPQPLYIWSQDYY